MVVWGPLASFAVQLRPRLRQPAPSARGTSPFFLVLVKRDLPLSVRLAFLGLLVFVSHLVPLGPIRISLSSLMVFSFCLSLPTWIFPIVVVVVVVVIVVYLWLFL